MFPRFGDALGHPGHSPHFDVNRRGSGSGLGMRELTRYSKILKTSTTTLRLQNMFRSIIDTGQLQVIFTGPI